MSFTLFFVHSRLCMFLHSLVQCTLRFFLLFFSFRFMITFTLTLQTRILNLYFLVLVVNLIVLYFLNVKLLLAAIVFLLFASLLLFLCIFSNQFSLERKTNATRKTAKLGSRTFRRKVLSLLGLAAQVTLPVLVLLVFHHLPDLNPKPWPTANRSGWLPHLDLHCKRNGAIHIHLSIFFLMFVPETTQGLTDCFESYWLYFLVSFTVP